MDKSKSPQTADLKSALSQLETTLEEYLVKKAPFTIPNNIRELLVKIAPWLVLIGVILAIPGILVLLGLGTIVAPFAVLGGVRAIGTFSLSMIFVVIVLILEAIALPGLFKRSRSGWNFLFYATLVGVIQNIISFNIGGLIIGSLLSLYILFQVKGYYK